MTEPKKPTKTTKTANEQKVEDAQVAPITAQTPRSIELNLSDPAPYVLSFPATRSYKDIIKDVDSISGVYLNSSGRLYTGTSRTDPLAAELNRDVERLRAQVEQLQKELANNTQTEHIQSLEQKVQELATVAAQVQVRSAELTAPVIIPASEDMRIHLVPAHSLERLEEYRADESRYMLFVGIFAGTISGILVNWFTSEQFTVTNSSLVLLGLLVLLMVGCVYRIFRINQRADKIRIRMFHSETAPRSIDE